MSEIVSEIDIRFERLCLPCGTGATLAGVLTALPAKTSALGFSVLKAGNSLIGNVNELLGQNRRYRENDWAIIENYHFGGFAKTDARLLDFIRRFEQINAIPLEPVYTGKMMFGVYELIKKGFFRQGQRIVALHTGGLQGSRGFLQ